MNESLFWCKDHLDENDNHVDCNVCNTKGRCNSFEEKITCPRTGELLKKLGETMHGGYTKFNSLTSEQKRKILKSRSHQHFKKHIEEKKVHMNRQVNPNYEPNRKKK